MEQSQYKYKYKMMVHVLLIKFCKNVSQRQKAVAFRPMALQGFNKCGFFKVFCHLLHNGKFL